MPMHVVIDGNYLGTRQHLSYDGEIYKWVSEMPSDGYVFGSQRGPDLRESLRVSGVDIQTFGDTSHAKSMRLLVGSHVKIPWFHVMPKWLFRKQLTELLDGLWKFTVENMGGYYINIVGLNRELLDRLQRPVVNTQLISKISNDASGGKSAEICKFMPPAGDTFAPATTYSMSGSITGRLTVASGPNILTLKREHRQVLRSRFSGGKIVQADISSLEPRIALGVAGKNPPEDIYEHIRDDVLDGAVSRSHSKLAVLSCIYGGGAATLGRNLPGDINPRKVISDVRRYFEIEKLQARLEGEIRKFGHIKNLYGRRIDSGDSLVNHMLQSSGVDVSFEVFRSILSSLDETLTEYVPIYVIHDALLLDVSPDAMRCLEEISSRGVFIEKVGCKFPLKVDIITEER